ncbi:MAG: hypothetical protein COB02_04535 [Candidatus Cloacimonadota bacterium]|nr:MAG: hypothetical protein COB02_04535 [Candidatus Cloacimonadota bacterium]
MNETNFNTVSIGQVKKVVIFFTIAIGASFLLWLILGFRINVPQNKILVLTKLFGTSPKQGSIVSLNSSQKGIQYDVKSEGWHWYSSFIWKREIYPATIIEAKELGVLIRQYGEPLENGKVLASPLDLNVAKETDTRGIVAEVLKPGKYNINPYAYKIVKFPVSEVPAGHVGIIIDKTGNDHSGFNYLASIGQKGIRKETKSPGTYYINPFVNKVIPYNIRVQKTDFDGYKAISFMSYDSYEIKLTATVEWRVDKSRASEVYARIGSLKDIENKIIIPFARSYCRIIGAKSLAREYISGDARQSIQVKFKEMLKEKSGEHGILISSVLIKKIVPPLVLREVINKRGLEKETREKLLKDIEKVKSDAQVAKRREEIKKSQARVEEIILKRNLLTKVKGDRTIALKRSNKNLAIARVDIKTAAVEKQTIIAKGEADLISEFNKKRAEAEALRMEISSFGSGKEFAKFKFNKKIDIQKVFTNDDSPIAMMLNQFGMPSKENGVK